MTTLILDTNGVSSVGPKPVQGKKGNYYAFKHGEEGRGRWQVQFPLGHRDFPYDELGECDFGGVEFNLIPLKGKKDKRDNQLYILGRGRKNSQSLVFWSLSPGYRGGASYSLEGEAEVISEGYEAQGAAGRMGGAPCPVVLVKGPCVLKWERRGRLYGSDSHWVARFDGQSWTVQPQTDDDLEDAIFG